MKYLMLIFANPESPWTGSEEDLAGLRDLYAVRAELSETGELLGSEGLTDAADAKTVRAERGAPVVTDGPFGEAKEHLAGFFLVECATPERAAEVAAAVSAAVSFPVELRPVMDHDVMMDVAGVAR